MSLVQAVVTYSFVLMCGDKKANFKNGEESENFVKVFKLNPNIIFGIAGNIHDNQKLFHDYLNVDFENCNLCVTKNCNETLNDFFRIITNRFNEIIKHQDSNIHSLICGWDGEKFVGKSFFTSTGITDAIPLNEGDVKFLSSGDNRHIENFLCIKDKYPFNILGMKNTLRDVLEKGVKFDSSINNISTFESIRISDIH